MKNIIYYFSGTGNSLFIAKKMAERLGNCEVKPITKALHSPLETDVDCIGLSFPVYAFRPPHIVLKFLKKLKKEAGDNYIFAIANSAGEPGNVVKITAKALGKKRLKLGFSPTTPSNYLPFMTELSTTEELELILQKAVERVDEMAGLIKKRELYLEKTPNRFKAYLVPGLLYGMFYPLFPRLDKQFYVEDSCNGCGLCEKSCPVDNIKMKEQRPTWHQHCEQCYACINWCPQEAIQYGKQTKGKQRYHHREIKLSDIGEQRLKQ